MDINSLKSATDLNELNDYLDRKMGNAPMIFQAKRGLTNNQDSRKEVRIATYNVHVGSFKFQEILSLVLETKVDVIGLQEVSQGTFQNLQKALKMEGAWAAAPWQGNGILSCFNIIDSRRVVMEDRTAIVCDLEITSQKTLRVVSTHLCHLKEERRIAQMNLLLSDVTPPFVLMGDMNALNRMDYTDSEWKEIIYMRRHWEYPESELLSNLLGEWGFIDSMVESKDFTESEHKEKSKHHNTLPVQKATYTLEDQNVNEAPRSKHEIMVETGHFVQECIQSPQVKNISDQNIKQNKIIIDEDCQPHQSSQLKEQNLSNQNLDQILVVVDEDHHSKQTRPIQGCNRWLKIVGTCQYDTRIDYVLRHQDLPWTFKRQSYEVKDGFQGSDHNMVVVELKPNDSL